MQRFWHKLSYLDEKPTGVQAEISHFSLFFSLWFWLDCLTAIIMLELIETFLHDSDFLHGFIDLEHLVQLGMSFLHFENYTAALNWIEPISASDQKFHRGLLQIFLIDVLSINAHDVLISLHLAKLAHEHVEGVLSSDVNLWHIFDRSLGFVFPQISNLVLNLGLCEALIYHLLDPLFSLHFSKLCKFLHLFILDLFFVVSTVRVSCQERILLLVSIFDSSLAHFITFFKFVSLSEIACKFIECGLVAVFGNCSKHGHFACQNVENWGVCPVVDNHLELERHLVQTFILFLVAKVFITRLYPPSFLPRYFSSSLCH